MNALSYLRTVLWSFLGIRGGSGGRQDLSSLRPLPLIVTGLVLAGLFVLLLSTLARWAVAGLS
jgi:hypothetical protein